MNTRIVTSLAAMTVAVAALGATTTAFADTPELSINTGSGWVHSSTTPLFSLGQIVPGWAQTSTFEIRSDASGVGVLYLGANNIVEDENGCTHDEALVDGTCGPKDGELGHYLQFSVFLDPESDGTFEATPAWTGSLYDITTPIVLSPDMPVGSTWGVRVDANLPSSTGNVTQSDQVGFDFALTLTGIGAPDTPGTPGGGGTGVTGVSTEPGTQTPQGPGSVEVKGINVSRQQHDVLQTIAGELPFTGSPTDRLFDAALLLAAAGSLFCVAARARRRGRVADQT